MSKFLDRLLERSVPVLIVLLPFVIIAAAIATAPSNQSIASTLEAQGLSKVQVHGYRPWGCSEDDLFRVAFSATGVNGRPVQGMYCSGVFKAATIRFN